MQHAKILSNIKTGYTRVWKTRTTAAEVAIILLEHRTAIRYLPLSHRSEMAEAWAGQLGKPAPREVAARAPAHPHSASCKKLSLLHKMSNCLIRCIPNERSRGMRNSGTHNILMNTSQGSYAWFVDMTVKLFRTIYIYIYIYIHICIYIHAYTFKVFHHNQITKTTSANMLTWIEMSTKQKPVWIELKHIPNKPGCRPTINWTIKKYSNL